MICYICFEPENKKLFVKLNCCNNNYLHYKCLYNTLILCNKTCPLCRKNVNIADYFNIDEIICYFNNMVVFERLEKINKVITTINIEYNIKWYNLHIYYDLDYKLYRFNHLFFYQIFTLYRNYIIILFLVLLLLSSFYICGF